MTRTDDVRFSGLQPSPTDSPIHMLAAQPQHQVILIDTYEKLAPLGTCLREQFLPQLSEQVLVVIAGRHPPPMAW